MKAFSVTVKTMSGRIVYEAIATTSVELTLDAYDRFGACGVSVRPRSES